MEVLEDEADAFAAESSAFVFAERAEIVTIEVD